MDSTTLPNVVGSLGPADMLAGNAYFSTLPPDQWVVELQNWFNTAMTAMQLNSLQYVTGDGNPEYDRDRIPGEEWMCSNQIIQRPDFSSFSVFGICMILVVAGLIFIVDLFLEPFLLRRSALARNSCRPDWVSQDTLQMQRMILEAHGCGGRWKGKFDDVPLTESDEEFVRPVTAEAIGRARQSWI